MSWQGSALQTSREPSRLSGADPRSLETEDARIRCGQADGSSSLRFASLCAFVSPVAIGVFVVFYGRGSTLLKELLGPEKMMALLSASEVMLYLLPRLTLAVPWMAI